MLWLIAGFLKNKILEYLKDIILFLLILQYPYYNNVHLNLKISYVVSEFVIFGITVIILDV